MKSIEISLGQAAMHSPWLVHAPNPSASICATICTTRVARSGCPCGSRPRCATLAATNSIAEALGQAATQAPQPMHCAASIASSASRLGTGTAFASGALPVRTVMKPPAWMMRSKALRSTTRSFTTGTARAADALAAVVVERHRLLASGHELLVQHVQQLEERHVGRQIRDLVAHEPAPGRGTRLAPHVQDELHT